MPIERLVALCDREHVSALGDIFTRLYCFQALQSAIQSRHKPDNDLLARVAELNELLRRLFTVAVLQSNYASSLACADVSLRPRRLCRNTCTAGG